MNGTRREIVNEEVSKRREGPNARDKFKLISCISIFFDYVMCQVKDWKNNLYKKWFVIFFFFFFI